jgi:hypothetical protein
VIDNKKVIEVDALEIVIANGASFGVVKHWKWGDGIHPDDGVGDICIVR